MRSKAKHEWKWLHQYKKFMCAECGRTTKSPGGIHRPCRLTCDDDKVHRTHEAYFSHQCSDGAKITFCVKCGCWATCRFQGLRKVCQPSRSSARARLIASRHPNTKTPLLPGRRINKSSHCNGAQQDQVEKPCTKGHEYQTESNVGQAQCVDGLCTQYASVEETNGLPGEQWDPGLGWAGFDDPDAEW